MRRIIGRITEKFSDNRFVTVVFSVITISFVIFTICYFRISSASMKKEFLQSTDAAMEQVRDNLARNFDTVDSVSEAVFANDTVQSALAAVGDPRGHLNEYRMLENFLNSMEYNRNMRISLYVSDKKMYSADRVHFYPLSEAVSEPWYDPVARENGRVQWITGGMCRMNELDEDVPVISCARLIKSKTDFKKSIGIVKVDVLVSDILDFIDSIVLVGDHRAFLMDAQGTVLLSSEGGMSDSELFNSEEMTMYFTEPSGIFERKNNGEKECVIYRQLPEQDWYLVTDIPNKEISRYRTISYIVSTFSVMFALIMLFSILCIYAVYSRIISNKLQDMVGKINVEDIEVLPKVVPESKSKIDVLESRVDDAIRHINKITKAYYDSKLREEKALMTALQAQINPHFLYNVLDAINWVAISSNNREISSMISLLASYFRQSLGMGKNVVTIKDEIELVRVYIEIQQFRFQNKIDVNYDVEEELLKYSIPKMTMQPIIENAIEHGICKNSVSNGRIDIEVKRNNDMIYISIKDDGCGTDESKLNESIIHSRKDGDSYVKSGYGLHNVYERVVLFSDNSEKCGIRGKSSSDGTEITIIIKAKTDETTKEAL